MAEIYSSPVIAYNSSLDSYNGMSLRQTIFPSIPIQQGLAIAPSIPIQQGLAIAPSIADSGNLAVAHQQTGIEVVNTGNFLSLFSSNIQQNIILDMGLSLCEMLIDDLTEMTAYKMQIIANSASDDYSDDFIPFDFYTRFIFLSTWDNPVDIIFTRHGTENFYIAINGFGFLKKLAVRGYKIKNSNPTLTARYQLVALG